MCVCVLFFLGGGGWEWWNNADMVRENVVFREKPKQPNFSHHKAYSHWLQTEQIPDIYNRSWSRNRHVTILFLHLLLPNHMAVIINKTTTSTFRSTNTDLRTWSCTTTNVRCRHSTKGKWPATQQQSAFSHITAFWPQLVATRQIQQQLE
jgi:hypothetical protein